MVHDEIRQYMRENHIKIKGTAEKIGMPPKTLYGMLDMVRKGLVDGSACYLHTGGFSALFSQF